jgi:hypothetical protein
LGDLVDALTFVLIIAGAALLVQAGLASIVGYLAAKRGRSAMGYFWLSFLLTFVIGLIILLIQTSGSQRVKRDYQNPNFGFLDGERAAKCPKCAEWIKAEASVCKHCGHEAGEYIQAQMQAQQAEESARLEKLEKKLTAEREASKAARSKLLTSKKFRLSAGAGTLVLLILGGFTATNLARSETAKQPAPVTGVDIIFDRKHSWNPYCPVVQIFADTSLDGVRAGLIESGDFEDSSKGLDMYDIQLNGDRQIRASSSRMLNSFAKAYLDDKTCRSLAFKMGASTAANAGNTWTYDVFGSNHWTEEKLLFSDSATVSWEKPNYSFLKKSWFDNFYIYDFEPKDFESSATSLEFVGLEVSEAGVAREGFLSGGSMWVQRGKSYTVEFRNPAGSQIIKIEGR